MSELQTNPDGNDLITAFIYITFIFTMLTSFALLILFIVTK